MLVIVTHGHALGAVAEYLCVPPQVPWSVRPCGWLALEVAGTRGGGGDAGGSSDGGGGDGAVRWALHSSEGVEFVE